MKLPYFITAPLSNNFRQPHSALTWKAQRNNPGKTYSEVQTFQHPIPQHSTRDLIIPFQSLEHQRDFTKPIARIGNSPSLQISRNMRPEFFPQFTFLNWIARKWNSANDILRIECIKKDRKLHRETRLEQHRARGQRCSQVGRPRIKNKENH